MLLHRSMIREAIQEHDIVTGLKRRDRGRAGQQPPGSRATCDRQFQHGINRQDDPKTQTGERMTGREHARGGQRPPEALADQKQDRQEK